MVVGFLTGGAADEPSKLRHHACTVIKIHSTLSLHIYSYRTHQESYLTYQKVGTYSTVSQCCSGYVGAPPDCQGKELSVEHIQNIFVI